MRKLKFKLDRKSLQTIYFSFIRPLIEYADVVWNNCTQYEVNEPRGGGVTPYILYGTDVPLE